MRQRLLLLTTTFVIAICPALCRAHYLWVIVDPTNPATANIYFEEGPGPGDGHYLPPIKASNKTWVRTLEDLEGSEVSVKEVATDKHKWLTAPLSGAAPRSVEVYGQYGVYRYGKTDVLLHYYAKTLDLSEHEHLHELGKSDRMAVDLSPHDFGKRVTVTVRWKGKPVADRTVYIRGPGFRKNVKTDENGQVTIEAEKAGRYTFRSYVELAEPGTHDGKAYSLIRHHGSLVMNLPLEK